MMADTIPALTIDKSDWKKVTLGDVIREVRETSKNPVAEGLERIVGLEHLESENLHIKTWGSTAEETTFTKKFRKGQVLFGRRRAYLKKAALATFSGICSGDITVLEAKGELLPALLPFLIQNDKFFDLAIKNSAGSLSPRAKFNDFANYEFLLPPIEQQQQIADLLWAGDEMIERHEHLANQSAKLIESTLSTLRSDSLNHDDSSVSLSKRRVGRLDSFFVLQRGHDITEKDAISGSVPVVSSSGTSYYHNEAKCQPPGVITGRKGKLGDVFYSDIPYWPHDTTLWVKDFRNNYPKYIYWFLKSMGLQSWNAATAVPTLNRNIIHPIIVSIPQYDMQVKISDQLEYIQKSMMIIRECLTTSRDFQKSVVNQFF